MDWSRVVVGLRRGGVTMEAAMPGAWYGCGSTYACEWLEMSCLDCKSIGGESDLGIVLPFADVRGGVTELGELRYEMVG